MNALDRLVLLSGDNWTESLNKAAQAYALIQAADQVFLREYPNSPVEPVNFR